MEGVVFEEEDLIRSPNPVYKIKKESMFSKLLPKSLSENQKKKNKFLLFIAVILIVVAFLISKGIIGGTVNTEVKQPKDFSEAEKYRLPDNIKAYIK